ncbi:MAG: glycosyl hydrolase, partial [Candidatus Krumholzibacteria bacterium]|nr:glycosyl hydrolase [Candidatus Krumholzibacteria bacterium]
MKAQISTGIIVALLISVPVAAQTQYPNIRVSDPASTNPEEIVITINPANPLNLAIGANIDYYYYSLDGGQTWTEGRLSSTLGVFGDPCVVFDADGNLYYSHLSNPPSPGTWLDRIVVQKSTDGGATWSDGVGVGHNPPKQQDKEWMAVDLTDSAFRNTIYMAWTEFDSLDSHNPADSTHIVLSRSTDGGSSWSTPIQISDEGGTARDDHTTVEGVVPAIGPNGEVYTSWAANSLIYFDKSIDGGATFGKDVIVTTQPGGWIIDIPGIFRCNGWPVTACDVSNSPYRGHIYVSWSDQRNGSDDTDVFLIKSTDGGATWHSRVRVNDDTRAAHQFFPWMTVDPVTGRIYFVFYDRRRTTGNATDVYVAVSKDGGANFDNFMVSDSSFTPTDTVFFGDYIGIAARDGMVYPAWARMDGTDLSVWMTIIEDTKTDNVTTRFKLQPSYPNPFNGSTTIV